MAWKVKSGSKYGNRRVKADGYTFGSNAEFQRYCVLKLRQKAGEISNLTVHPRFTFTYDGRPVTYESGRKVTIELDFSYTQDGAGVCYEDVKGRDNLISKIKRAFFEAKYYPARVVLVAA